MTTILSSIDMGTGCSSLIIMSLMNCLAGGAGAGDNLLRDDGAEERGGDEQVGGATDAVGGAKVLGKAFVGTGGSLLSEEEWVITPGAVNATLDGCCT